MGSHQIRGTSSSTLARTYKSPAASQVGAAGHWPEWARSVVASACFNHEPPDKEPGEIAESQIPVSWLLESSAVPWRPPVIISYPSLSNLWSRNAYLLRQMSTHAQPHVTCSLPSSEPLKFFTGQAARDFSDPFCLPRVQCLLTLWWESWIFSSGTLRRGRDAAERLRARALLQHLSAPRGTTSSLPRTEKAVQNRLRYRSWSDMSFFPSSLRFYA